MTDPHQTRWQRITLFTLFVGYGAYYLCRSNLDVTAPLIVEEYESRGITKEHIGAILSSGMMVYAVGKLINGMLADFFGGRRLFLLGMFASVLCTIVFGLATGVVAFGIVWCVNRYFQSMGWVSLVKTASRWFPVHRHATLMGVLSTSYLFGDALVRLYLGAFIKIGLGWRGIFFLSAGTLGIIWVISRANLRASPQEVGAAEPPANPTNIFGQRGEQERPASLGQLLRPFLRTPIFWLMCAISFCLNLIRQAFSSWSPTFLHETTGIDIGSAAIGSLFFPLAGAVSALLVGRLSDSLGRRHGRIIVPSLLCVIVALTLLSTVSVESKPVLAVVLVASVAFFLLGPYTLFSGVMALELGGKQGSSTAAGIVDSAGYLGAVVSGWGVAKIAEDHGWHAAFRFLTIICVIAVLIAIVYWISHERRLRRTASDG